MEYNFSNVGDFEPLNVAYNALEDDFIDDDRSGRITITTLQNGNIILASFVVANQGTIKSS